MAPQSTPTYASDNMRILHIASWYPSMAHRTLGNFVQRHVQAIATLQPSEVWYAAPVEAGRDIPLNETNESERLTERIAYFKAQRPVVMHTTRALLRLAEGQESSFDAIHLHVAYPAGQAARILAKRWNVPLILTEHWTAYHADQRQKLPFWRKRSMRLTGRACQLICPVSEDLAESMRTFGMGDKFRVVPNVVDTKLFHPSAEPSSKDSFEFLHISSLVDDHKNVSGILRAAAVCLNEQDNMQWTILGDGDPKPHQEFAKSLGIGQHISIGGEIKLDEVAKRMRQASALILFSHFENFPCVIPEAWASGIPVISSDVGGIREHLNDERGRLVPAGDEEALIKAIREIRQSPWDSMALRMHAENVFSVKAVARAFHGVYQSLEKR